MEDLTIILLGFGIACSGFGLLALAFEKADEKSFFKKNQKRVDKQGKRWYNNSIERRR